MIVTLRSSTPLSYQQVVDLQRRIVASLKQPVSLKVNQVFAEQLDPLIPPTPTPTFRLTETPLPSPSITASPIPSPTSTPTATATPALVQAGATPMPPLRLYQSPDGPVIGTIYTGQTVRLLYGKETMDGVVWVQVMDSEGRIGWVPDIYLRLVTPTASRTAMATFTP